MSYDGFRQQRNQVYCEAVFRCCAPAQRNQNWADAQACEKDLDANPDGQSIANGIAAKALSFDARQAQACLDATKTLYAACDQTVDPSLPACAAVVVGLAAVGQPCQLDVDCVPDAFCRLTATTSGTCAARATMGERCSGSLCTVGLECLPGDTCGAPLMTGAVCEQDAQCVSRSCAGAGGMALTCGSLPTARVVLCGK